MSGNERKRKSSTGKDLVLSLKISMHNLIMIYFTHQQNQDLEIMSRDIENDISQLLDTKRVLMKEMEGLERESRYGESYEPGVRLHRTSRHTNLVIRDEQLSEDTASIGEPEYVGGTHLHRSDQICCRTFCLFDIEVILYCTRGSFLTTFSLFSTDVPRTLALRFRGRCGTRRSWRSYSGLPPT